MPRQPDRQRYEKLVDHYRQHPDDHEGAGRAAGCAWRTARDYYLRGVPGIPWAGPIKDLLAREVETRRLAEIAEQQRRQQALVDAEAKERAQQIEARAEELAIVGLARKNALGAVSSVAYVVPVLVDAVQELAARLKDPVQRRKLDVRELTRLVQALGGYSERVERIAALTLQLDRTHAGEPLAVVELRHTGDTTELEAQIGQLRSVLERAAGRSARPRPTATVTPASAPALGPGDESRLADEEERDTP